MGIASCIATPSRVIVEFDGDPGTAAKEPESYVVGRPDDAELSTVTSSEFDSKWCRAVLAVPLPNVRPGEWLRVEFRRGATQRMTFFARVRREAQIVDGRSDITRASVPRPTAWQDLIADSPGPIIVIAGLVVLLALGGVALKEAPNDDMNTIAAAAFGVIGSIVGAFFGVHAGAGERRRADEAHRHITEKLTDTMMEQAKAMSNHDVPGQAD